MTSTVSRDRGLALTEGLLWCGVLAGPLFVVAFLLEGATRADYSPMRHPVSSLALGPSGWVQVVNFTVTGILYLAFAAGLLLARRRSPSSDVSRIGAVLIGLAGVGLLGAGAFATDPISGYPPGTPDVMTSYTTSGALHDTFSTLTFFGVPAAAIAFAWRSGRSGDTRWSVLCLGAAALFLAGFVLASVGFSQQPGLVGYGGFFQRVTIVIGLGWLTLLAVRTRRAVTRGSGQP